MGQRRLTEVQIAKNLGISKTTLETYKKEQPNLLTALKKGKEVLIAEIENALIKRAKGFSYDEIKTYIKEENGKKVKYTEKAVRTVAPDTGACCMLLKNKDKDHYTDQPAMLELKKEMLELQKEAMKLKEW